MKQKPLGSHTVRPHIMLIRGLWRVVWRERSTGIKHPDEHIYFITRSSISATKARQFAQRMNTGRSSTFVPKGRA